MDAIPHSLPWNSRTLRWLASSSVTVFPCPGSFAQPDRTLELPLYTWPFKMNPLPMRCGQPFPRVAQEIFIPDMLFILCISQSGNRVMRACCASFNIISALVSSHSLRTATSTTPAQEELKLEIRKDRILFGHQEVMFWAQTRTRHNPSSTFP